MRNFKKRICLIGLTLLGSACFLSGTAISRLSEVQADAATLETEFTNEGQFSISQYSTVAYEFVDGASEGLPAGYDGAVLRVVSSGGAAYVTVDFSGMQILASEVASIMVRAYSPDYTADDEFRTTSLTSTLVQYGAGAYDMSTWCDIPLKATTISQMTDENGYLTSIILGLRDKGTISQYFYIDSITVNMKSTTKVTFNQLHSLWNNYPYDNANCTYLMFDGGISGNGNLDADFSDLLSKMTLNDAAVDSSIYSFYCPNWIGADGGIIMRVATNPAAGSVLTLSAGATFNIGGSDTNLYEITEDVYLQFDGTVWTVSSKPASGEMATFVGVWGEAGDFNCEQTVLLQYSSASEWNYADMGDLVSKITLKNTQTGESVPASDVNLVGWEGQRWIVLRALAGYDVVEIASGGTFGGVVIPGLKLSKVHGCWVSNGPQAATTSYTGMAGGWNNAKNEGAGQTILKFEANPLGNAADATNLASTINATSLMVKYNGKSFAEHFANVENANRAKYMISYAHGHNYFFFSIPETDLVDGATFEIEEGTPFMNQYLPKVTLKYNASAGIWESFVDMTYGEPTFSAATESYVGAWGWNHATDNTAVIKDANYGYTIVADWAMSGSDNLAATESVTSLSITLNGVSFYELYQADDGYRLNAQLGFFAFSVPTSALVAGNGYEYPTLEIVNGTPFYAGNYLPETTLIYKDGAWQLPKEEVVINYNPSFVSIGELNHMENETLQAYGLSLVFDTVGFTVAGQQIMPASSSGFTLNGDEVRPALWGGEQLLFWLGMAKCEAGYNGYSHATLKIADGAKIVNENGEEFTLSELTMYLVDGVWTTEQPADYTVVVIDTTNYNPDFVKIGSLNHYDHDTLWGLSLVFDTTGFTSDQQIMAESWDGFTLNGESQAVALWGGNQLLFWMKKEYCEPGYNMYSHATLKIAEGATIINDSGKLFTFKALTLYLVDGAWTTEMPEGYEVLEPTNFASIDASTTNNAVVFTFEDDFVWSASEGTLAAHVLFDGVTTLEEDGGSVTADPDKKTVTVRVVGNYSKIQITNGGDIAGVRIPEVVAYSTETGWELKPQSYNTLTGIGVYGNNNRPAHEIYHTVLSFSEYFVLGGNDGVNDATNMASSADYEVATKVTLNGKSFYELYQEDPRFYIGYMSGGKYFTFQIPALYLDGQPENGYEYHTIEIEDGTVFMDWKLPALTMICFDKVWMNADGFNPEPLVYGGIPYGWNCMQNGANIDTILQFGKYEFDPSNNSYLGDYLGEDNGTISRADATNLAAISSEQIATKMTINGVPVKDISGITVSYAHGYSLLYISVPAYELCPNDDYKCVVLHIEANTVFKKSVLSEVTLYLVDGQWQTEPPTTVNNDKAGTYLTASDLFGGASGGYYANGVYKLTDADDNAEIVSSAKVANSGVIYNFLYKSSAIDFDYSLFTGATDDFGGVRVTIYRNLGESTQGFNVYVNGALQGSKQAAFMENEWYAIRIAILVQNGNINVSVAVDGIEVVHAETECDGILGEEIKLKKAYGDLSFADFRTGDIKSPTIYWQGKNVYRFSVGEVKPADGRFAQVISVSDNYDKANFGAEDIIVTWQDGAIKDGKLQKGEWLVTFSVSDKAGNVAYYSITALVTNPYEITVTLQVEGETSYVISAKGALLAKPADPTKEGDELVNYIFDGWYLGDKKWDFANDYAFEDMELVAVFTVEYKEYAEYTVTVVSEGLEAGYTYTFKLLYGSTLDTSIFERDGYTYKLMSGGQEIDQITVDGELQITVVYTADIIDSDSSSDSSESSSSDEPGSDVSTPVESSPVDSTPKKKSGCRGSINGCMAGMLLTLVASAFIFARKFSKKEGK